MNIYCINQQSYFIRGPFFYRSLGSKFNVILLRSITEKLSPWILLRCVYLCMYVGLSVCLFMRICMYFCVCVCVFHWFFFSVKTYSDISYLKKVKFAHVIICALLNSRTYFRIFMNSIRFFRVKLQNFAEKSDHLISFSSLNACALWITRHPTSNHYIK